jgi:hypothetical protein
MNDTPDHVRKIQYDIILSKTPEERFLMGIEMMEDVRRMVEGSIREQNSGISDIDLKIAVFKRYYSKDFSPARLDDIVQSMKAWHAAQSGHGK